MNDELAKLRACNDAYKHAFAAIFTWKAEVQAKTGPDLLTTFKSIVERIPEDRASATEEDWKHANLVKRELDQLYGEAQKLYKERNPD